MTNPLVSLITIVFNGEKHLEKTIRSVLAQDYPNIEYIVIDGGSSDSSVSIIRSFEDKIAYWISEPDKGISDAINKGIKASKGELIGLINSDDWLEPNAIENVMKAYEPNTILYGDVSFWVNGTKTRSTHSNHNRLREGMTLAHPAVYVPKKFYETFGNFNTNYKVAMDYDMLLRLYMNKLPFKNINCVLVNMNLGGISDKRWLLGIKEELRSKNIYFNRLANLYYFMKQFTYLFLQRLFR
jgi:glycosyltransferase involved in cell wall biosynthesis